jgi:hypothetical protein
MKVKKTAEWKLQEKHFTFYTPNETTIIKYFRHETGGVSCRENAEKQITNGSIVR